MIIGSTIYIVLRYEYDDEGQDIDTIMAFLTKGAAEDYMRTCIDYNRTHMIGGIDYEIKSAVLAGATTQVAPA